MSRQTAIIAIVLSAVCSRAYDMVPRWGHASVYISEPPSLLIHGGKTSTPDHSYSTSPNSPDLIRLPLSSNFSLSSPPYELVNTSASPAYAWHTLSILPNGQALVFGGDGGPSTPLPAGTDSAWILSSDSSAFTQQPWQYQPQRRILHSTVSGPDGTVYIIGGQRNDGSGMILADAYAFNPNTSIFNPLPNLPRGVAHHVSAFLPNGTLVVVGGIYTSQETSNPTLRDIATIYTLDTKSSTPAWWEVGTAGAPSARRGAAGVLIDEKLYMIGGTGMTSAEAMGDVWILDLKSGSWSQLNASNGPSARFDHTGMNIGQGRILVFGGYSAGGAASTQMYIFDTTSNAWLSDFAIAPTPSTASATSTPTNPSPSDQAGVNSVSPAQSQTTSIAASTPASTESATSASPSSSESATSSSPALSKGAQIGLALGVTMGLGALAVLVILLIRRRKVGYGGAGEDGWFSPRPPPVEKDGQALLGDPRALPSEWSEKGGIIGLGLGAVGAGLSAFRPKDYHQIEEEPIRRPTRRAGQGIKLLGPRQNPSAAKSPPRVDMLGEEDSRMFRKEEDWKVDRKGRDEWRSAETVLGQAVDPFEDVPLIRGGPVPTPVRSEIDPFEDHEADIASVSRGPGLYQLPPLASSDPLDIAGLLAPGYGDSSLPRSNHSRISTAFSSDAEEGIIHHAQFASQGHAVYSPQEEEYVPIKRNESFFRRMAAGGITTLMGRRTSVRRSESVEIRDPAPGPSLWPVQSREEPPSAWNNSGHAKGPSLSSLASARSMRDMVIVRRDGTDSSEGSCIIESESREGTPMVDPPRVFEEEESRFFASPTEEDFTSPQDPASTSQSLLPTDNPAHKPTIPAGSPLPKYLVEHRRPVKDMVFSINKRASHHSPQEAVLSPTSQYSATPGATPMVGHPRWEVRRRESLVVANPDKRRALQ